MERHNRQDNWQPSIRRFSEYVKLSCELEILDPGLPEMNTPEKTRPFMPKDRIQGYFEKQDYKELRSIISALFPTSDPINPREILPKYTSVFCTLLYIGRGGYIKHFLHYDSLNDMALPFDPASPPAHLPEALGDKNFLHDFCNAQWRFCVPTLEDPFADKHFENQRILPIIYKRRLAGGGTANLWLIKIHPSYNKLVSNETKNRLKEQANTFVLKEYSTLDAERYYNNETAAFNKIGTNPNIIGYYGSFRRGDRFNVLLEYADQGNLKEFFQKQQPPTNGDAIIQFWEGLFKLIDALRTVHSVEHFAEDGPRIFQGWHQDVRPDNILVVSNGSKLPHEWQFKLADLGISHFKAISTSRENSTASDSYGTRTYGAPECFRPDLVSGHTKLKVHQNIDIWSLGCVFSEAVRWLPPTQKYPGILAYCEERKAEIDKIPAFDGGDCFHNGMAVLDAVFKSHETAMEDLHRKDYITEKVVGMIEDMLVKAEARPSAHYLWLKQLRILETARKKLRPPGGSPQPPGSGMVSHALSDRRRPVPRHTDPVPRQSSAPMPPVLPPGFSVEATISPAVYRANWDTPEPSNIHIYDKNPLILGNEEGLQRHSPDSLDKYVDESIESSPNPKRNSQHTSQALSPSQQTKNTPLGYYFHDQHDLENIDEHHFEVPVVHASGQGLVSRPRGASQLLDYSTSRYSAPPTSMTPNVARSPMTEKQRQSLPTPPPVNGNGNYRQESMAPNRASQLDPFVETVPAHQNAIRHQFPLKFPLETPLGLGSNHNAHDSYHSPNVHYPNRQEPRPDRPQPHVIQNATQYLSLQDALDWKHRCKLMKAHAPGLDKDLQNRLKGRDHVFLIDDSVTMVDHWPMVVKVFEALSYIVKETDKDGLDLYFTISETCQRKAKKTSPLVSIIYGQKQRKNSTSDINVRLTKILDEYKSNLDNKKRWYRSEPRPLSLYVLTDGLWENECNAVEPIKNAVHKLEDLRKDDRQIGIQFISFGSDQKGLMRLRHLDDGLNLPKDIVDTESCHGNVYKMLLGSFNKGFDSQDQLSNMRAPLSELAESSNPSGYAR